MRIRTNMPVAVDAFGMRTEILLALTIIGIYAATYRPHWNCGITSIIDGKHSSKSLHYRGLAIDIDDNGLEPHELDEVLEDIRDRLGGQYDVIYHRNHFHIEWDPVKEI